MANSFHGNLSEVFVLKAAHIQFLSGQPDYSAQWAEYYRSMGMHEQAAVIENQLKQNAAAAAAAQQPAAQARPQQPVSFQIMFLSICKKFDCYLGYLWIWSDFW